MTNKTNATTVNKTSTKDTVTFTEHDWDSKEHKVKTPKYTLGDTVEYLQGTYEVVEVLSEGVHLKNVHKPFNSEVVKYNELTQG